MTQDVPGAEYPSRRPRRSRRSRPTFFSVLGELLITGGLLVLLFLGWQLYWNDWILAQQQSAAAGSLSRELQEKAAEPPSDSPPAAEGEPAAIPAALTAPPDGEAFALMFVPRFGPESHRVIAQGVGTNVLNSNRLGVGHYPSTQMPGEPGNFALASHRSAYGGGMHLVDELRVGDPIYIQTQDGWYTYRFRDMEYVQPTEVEVLAPVPNDPAAAAQEAIVTLTTCNPLYSTAERVAAYGVLESFTPGASAPAEIADVVAAWEA